MELQNRNDRLGHREPEHFVSNENRCTVIYLCPCVFFESFRRDLNEAKAVSCNVVNYLLSSGDTFSDFIAAVR